MSPADISRRRRAIYRGLCAVMPEVQARDAVELWTREFSGQESLALHGFITRLLERFPGNRSRQEIYTALWRALMSEARTPVTDADDAAGARAGLLSSANQVAGSAATLPLAADQRAARAIIASHVIDAMLAGLDEHAQGSGAEADVMRRTIATTLLNHDIGVSTLRALTLLVMTRQPLPVAAEYPESALRTLVNQIYVSTCEAIGPVAADRLLSRIMRSASALPEAASFAPKRML